MGCGREEDGKRPELTMHSNNNATNNLKAAIPPASITDMHTTGCIHAVIHGKGDPTNIGSIERISYQKLDI